VRLSELTSLSNVPDRPFKNTQLSYCWIVPLKMRLAPSLLCPSYRKPVLGFFLPSKHGGEREGHPIQANSCRFVCLFFKTQTKPS
jgi:hypothetical protein